MNNFLKTGLILSSAIVMLGSCKKDEKQVVLDSSGANITLTASTNTLVLSHNDSTKKALNLMWTNASLNYKAEIDYSVQISANATFSPATTVSVTGDSLSYLTPALNDLLINSIYNDTTPKSRNLYIRVEGVIKQTSVTAGGTNSLAPIYSNVVQLNVTTYHYVIAGAPNGLVLPAGYTSLYVPGDYQGWKPATADSVGSTDGKAYEGFANITGSTDEFKFTSAPDFNHTNYGDSSKATYSTTGNITTGHVSTDPGAGNLKVPASDYYQLKLDIPSKVWTATVTHWSVIGDAPTTGTAWSTDFPMVYDPSTQTLSVTLALTGGKSFKFRANADWGINFGDKKTTNSGTLDYNSANNITVPATTGNYKIVLDLSHPLVYMYTITKVP